MTAAEFLAWRKRHDWTQVEAAAKLGLVPRTVQFYEAGTHPIPEAIALLCLAYDRGFTGQ